MTLNFHNLIVAKMQNNIGIFLILWALSVKLQVFDGIILQTKHNFLRQFFWVALGMGKVSPTDVKSSEYVI